MLKLLQLLAWLLALVWFVTLSFLLVSPLNLLDVPSGVAGGLWRLQLLWMPLAVVVLVVAATLTIKQKPRIAFALVVLTPLLWERFVLSPQISSAENQQYLIDCALDEAAE